MNVISSKKILAALALILTISAVPATASARATVHLDLPGLSIGLHDRHFNNHRKRYRKHNRRHYRNHHRGYKRHHRYNSNRYYNDYPRRSSRYYDDRYYYDDYRSNRSRSRRSADYCPTPGYSNRYYRNEGCYAHGDHYHCDG